MRPPQTRSRSRSSARRGERGLLRAGVAWLCLLPASAILFAWAIGLTVSDRIFWTQFLAWLPTEAVVVSSGTALLCAVLLRARSAWRATRAIAALWAFALAWLLIAQWNLPRLVTGAPSRAGDLRIAYWNTSAERVRWPQTVTRVIDADVFFIANPAMWQRNFRILARDQRTASVGSMLVVTDLPILERGTTSLGVRGVIRGKDPKEHGEDAYSAGWATFMRFGVAQRDLVVWVIDLPSDPMMPRASATRTAIERINAYDDGAGFPPPDLVVGDFNIPRGSASLGHLTRGLREAHATIGVGHAASWPRPLPMWHIDLCFAADTVRLVDYDLLDVGDAEHLVQRIEIDFAR